MHKARLLKLILRKDYSTFHQRNMSNCEALNRPIENSIKGKLEAALKPLHCNVINESYMHNVPKNSETHFKVVVVSEKFDKQPLIKRHRMINQLLQAELQGGVHALSIVVSNSYYLLINPSLLARDKNYDLLKIGKQIYIVIYCLRQKHQSNGRQAIKRWLRVLFAGVVLENSVVLQFSN
ncbi:bolA-like protein 1 isoform X2 [Solenopsis invicta]|uniref:bolA-like protein 1 isoform X2 n=1 Tax=Solenopsis invicta TaxID=13686 RepID=UPI00193E4D88|nr:bolA-like protein 1 isoform X2 [Solenopsis invicta]